ncbi:hypothetical protein F8M41_020287 [Gigaspora margarita]|uniref:Uncharacterized protein n=1 Tax=Gigaspora margarita TaxID=4874 RepID=A0A8H4AIR1_GIGMA|nr:hypothetical protein F8M41_020287 [Gigaspora margarita]
MQRQYQEIYEATQKKSHKVAPTKHAKPLTRQLLIEKYTKPSEWRNVQDHLLKKHTNREMYKRLLAKETRKKSHEGTNI